MGPPYFPSVIKVKTLCPVSCEGEIKMDSLIISVYVQSEGGVRCCLESNSIMHIKQSSKLAVQFPTFLGLQINPFFCGAGSEALGMVVSICWSTAWVHAETSPD